jgi:tetratricopeptide (TPR) repeat protein
MQAGGSDATSTLLAKLNLALLLKREGRLAEAEALQRESLAAEVRVHGTQAPDTLSAQSDLAATLFEERRYTEAENLARRTYETQRQTLGPLHPDTLETLQELGMILVREGRYDEAKRLFGDPIDRSRDPNLPGNRWVASYRLASVAASAKHPDEAMQYLRDAIARGFKGADDALMNDDDLQSLRSNPEFRRLAEELRAGSVRTKSP